MPGKPIYCFVLFLCLLPFLVQGQMKKIGVPALKNFSKSDYSAATQNWDAAQFANGLMVFANNDGVLSFNGVNWDLIPVSDYSPVRSVFVDSNNTLYVGLINDFGLIKQEEPHAPVFVSLKSLLPDDVEEFDDVWKIHESPLGIVFQCYKYLFIYKDNQVKIIRPKRSFYSSFQLEDRLFVQEAGNGVYELINGVPSKIPDWEGHHDKNIRTILETDDAILIGTQSDGIFVLKNDKIETWDTPVNDFVIRNNLYSATKLPGNYYAFGTILNGLVICDERGEIIKLLHKGNGLQNNTILSTYVDREGDLWLGLDNGIDYIELGSPLSFVGTKDIGAGYSSIVFNEKLYLGTNQGLFVGNFDPEGEGDFELIENTAGQVWSLGEFNGELLCGHHRGTFRIENNRATKISNTNSSWKYIRLKNQSNFILGGSYNGLVLLENKQGRWTFHSKIKGFDESSRYLFQDADENIWIGHGGKGIYKLTLNGKLDSVIQLTHYTSKYGLPSNSGNVLLYHDSKVYASTNEGAYQYDILSDRFAPTDDFNRIFGDVGKVKALEAYKGKEIWFIAEKESGLVRKNEDLTYTKISSPFVGLNKTHIKEFEFVLPHDDNNIFWGVEDGFVHYTPDISKSYSQAFSVLISKIEIPYLDSILHIPGMNSTGEYLFPFRRNGFRFHFSAPFFEGNRDLEFSFFLEGFSEGWSTWSGDSYKDFTNLHEGSYNLMVKSRNDYGVESETASFQFVITPPWHRSGTAIFVYILMALALVFGITRFVLYRMRLSRQKAEWVHEQEMHEQEKEHQREALIAEKEIINLRNEKLKAEMIHRDKELANQTMGIIQKNKFLIKVNEDLLGIQDFIVNDTAKSKIYNLKKRIKREIDIKQQNKIFETYFDEVHEEFFKKLKEKYPVLTTNDLRICAFIRMNLSTQEIAAILNISYRGAEISRYRLRKKLELTRSTNLSTFLSGF